MRRKKSKERRRDESNTLAGAIVNLEAAEFIELEGNVVLAMDEKILDTLVDELDENKINFKSED